MEREYDLLAMGRSSIDLYANEVGAPFTEIKSFAAYVGGSPTNISVCARRLGLRTALLNAVGDDLVGDFVTNFLNREGVETRFGVRKPGRRTSAFLLGIEPPDRFPIVPYRDNCADLELEMDDVIAAPVAESRALLLTGTGLSRQPSRDATLFAAARAHSCGTKVVLDLDFRPELWPDVRAYGVAFRSIIPLVNVVIGTTQEVRSAILSGRAGVGADIHVTDGNTGGPPADVIEAALSSGPEALIIKRGADSTFVYARGGEVSEVPTFEVEVLNVLGAGDAFAAGFLYGYLKGWDLYRSARMGNACGAIVVTRHGCANFMPYEEEALAFIEERGGF
ncbi:MAG: 5-dehydro-2-deoxygluconokinase [Pyrinomonadaceae bacterium]